MFHGLSIWRVIILIALAVVLFGGLRLGWFDPSDKGPHT